MKHGPIALIDPHVPVIVLVPRDPFRDKSMLDVFCNHVMNICVC